MIKKLNEMKDSKYLNLKGLAACVILVLVYFLIPQLVGSFLFYKIGLSEMLSVAIGNILVGIIFLLVFLPMLKRMLKDYFSNSDNFHLTLKYWGIGFAIMMISNFILAYFIFPGQIAENEEINRTFLLNNPLIGFFEIVIVAPFVEEMIFRFGLRKAWGKNKLFPLFTAIIFGLLHALTGINSSKDLLELLYIIPYGALGYVFGLLYNKTDNIFSSTLAHVMHNFISFMIIFFFA